MKWPSILAILPALLTTTCESPPPPPPQPQGIPVAWPKSTTRKNPVTVKNTPHSDGTVTQEPLPEPEPTETTQPQPAARPDTPSPTEE